MIFDIASILAISLGSLYYFLSLKDNKKENKFRTNEFYIPLSGILWVIFSILWRAQFYMLGGFDLGLTQLYLTLADLEPTPLYQALLKNPVTHLFLFLGAVSLFFFLYFQEKDYNETFDTEDISSDVGTFGLGRASILGLVNIFGVIFLFLGGTFTPTSAGILEEFSYNPNAFFMLIGVMIKLLFTPPLVVYTSIRFITSHKMPLAEVEKQQNNNFNNSPYMNT
jgi:hypothetical protein